MNLVELIEAVRTDLLDSPNDNSVWGDTDAETEDAITRYMNRAQRFMMLARLENDQQFYMESATFDELGLTFESDGRFRTVIIPDYILSIHRIEQIGSTDSLSASHAIPNVPLANATGESLIRNTRVDSASLKWTYFGRRKLGFTGSNEGISGFRIYFTRVQPDLVQFTASAGATTTIDVDTLTGAIRGNLVGRADYYVGAKIQVTSANNLAPQEEISWVTGYAIQGAYPTFRFTIEPALSAAVSADDEIALIPAFEDEYHELLAYFTAQRAFDREGEVASKLSQSETMKQLWKQFTDSGDFRQTQRAHVPHFDRTH